MKNTKKAFTLVELIVVITILAVLATVAFISLTGYSQDAKNTKVTSDVATLAKAISTSLTEGKLTNRNIIATDVTAHAVSGNATITSKTGTSAIALSATQDDYETGLVDFGALQQNGDDFTDNDGNEYIAGTVSSGALAVYQIAGQVTEASGDKKGLVKGNYVVITSGDVTGLISQSGASITDPVLNDEPLPDNSIDLYGN